MWLAVEVTQVDSGITSLAIGDRFAIALVVNDSVLDTNSSIGGGQFPSLLSSFAMTALPGNTGTWQPSGTFNLPSSNFVTNAFGNAFTFQLRGSGFPDGGFGLPFFDVDLNFSWLGDITDSGLGDSFAQQLGTTFDPTRAVLGGSAIRFGASAQSDATLAVATNFSLWSKAGIGDWTTATNWRPLLQPNSSRDVNISNGGTAQITTAGAQARDVVLGQLAFGGSGHLELIAPAAALTAADIYVGDDGSGTLTIAAGSNVSNMDGTIGRDDGSSGTVTVTGAGSDWTNTGNLTIGDEGDGELTVAAGASVSNNVGVLALDNGSTGTVTVTGAGSNWTSSSFLVVGVEGVGELTVANGGSVSSVIGDVGRFATGTVIVTGTGSTWTNTGPLGVGDEGTGTLTIQNGGHVSNTDGSIGFEMGSSGTVTVDGAGSTWTNSGDLSVGEDGTGTLSILNGGAVLNANGFIGHNATPTTSSTGTVTVSGAGSTWTNNGNLLIGASGDGTLHIMDGGVVVSNAALTVDDDAYIGLGADGIVTVSGPGSMWTHHGSLHVGNDGDGELTIEDGGVVSVSAQGRIGVENGPLATVTVTGAGSSWNIGGDLAVADGGLGELAITAGGAVATFDTQIAQETGAVGTATVAGAGSTWTIGGRLGVGGNARNLISGGTGTLRIQPGSTVSVAQNTVLFSNGQLKLEGGTFGTSAISFQGGGQFQWTSGTLHVGIYNGNLTNPAGGTLAPGNSAGSTTIIGNYTQQAGATLQIEIGGPFAGGTYDLVSITGNATLGGQLQLAMLNGFIPSASNTFTVLNAAGSISGVFSNVTTGQRLTTIDGIGSFLVHYGPGSAFNQNQIVLTNFELVALPGDFNHDGLVDAGDYVVWRKTDGTPAGYNVWRSHFGQHAGSVRVDQRRRSGTSHLDFTDRGSG